MNKHLTELYLNDDSPTYLGGINPLYKAAKKKFPDIKIEDVEDFP